jgi:hypothetical protein
MGVVLAWLQQYSAPVVVLIALGAAALYVVKLVVERSVEAGFDQRAKVMELALQRRSAFEDGVLTARYALVTGLSARLQRVMTDLNRVRHGHPPPAGFRVRDEIVPLTELFEEITVQRLALGEDFHDAFQRLAQVALSFANAATAEEVERCVRAWEAGSAEVREGVERHFHISTIGF